MCTFPPTRTAGPNGSCSGPVPLGLLLGGLGLCSERGYSVGYKLHKIRQLDATRAALLGPTSELFKCWETFNQLTYVCFFFSQSYLNSECRTRVIKDKLGFQKERRSHLQGSLCWNTYAGLCNIVWFWFVVSLVVLLSLPWFYVVMSVFLCYASLWSLNPGRPALGHRAVS